MASYRWLLLVGSNLARDTTVREALQQLTSLGAVHRLTPIGRFASDDASPWPYFNALAQLDTALERAALIGELKALEKTLGRDADERAQISIDIDLLACANKGVWHADAHAESKGEFGRATVIELLRLADITPQRNMSSERN